MKPSEVKVGVTYVNCGAGKTQRKVLAIGHEHQPGYLLKGRPPLEPGVLFEQRGRESTLHLSSFAKWARGPVA